MKSLVTGATGYIGSQLCQNLVASGREVHALTRAQSNKQKMESLGVQTHNIEQLQDLTQFFTTYKFNSVFHLAGQYKPDINDIDTEDLLASNIVFPGKLLSACLKLAKPPAWINTGSFWQYNPEGQLQSTNFYAVTKTAFQKILFSYSTQLACSSLILYDVFGPNDTRPKLIPTIVKSNENKDFPMTPGEQLVSFVNVSDVISAYLIIEQALLNNQIESGNCYFVYNELKSLKFWIEETQRITSSKLNIKWGQLNYREHQLMKPYSGVKPPGWTCNKSFEQSIQELINE